MKKLLLLLVVVFAVNNTIKSQSYFGYTFDNYSGIHGLTLNPANVVDSPFKTDINIISGSLFAGSDYLGVNIQDIIKSEGGFDFDLDAQKSAKNDNNFFLNMDVLLPSFMFNLSKKSSLGITTRLRAFLNVHNINGQLYESLADEFDDTEDFEFNLKDFKGTVHVFGEIGLTYGRILMNNEKHLLKGGFTLKYLQGAGGAFFNAPSITGFYDASANTLTTSGNLNYGLSSEEFDSEDIDITRIITAGFGADIGFVYQWNDKNKNKTDDSTIKRYTKYKLKIGASITDIGSINYKEGKKTTYDLNNTIDVDDFDDENNDKSFEEILDDNYSSVTTLGSNRIKLPTALNLLIDYNITGKLFTSFASSMSLSNTATTNSIINTVTIAPRLEISWLSIYSPISFRQYGDVAWGAGLRLGPLTVGSGSVLTNLLSSNSKSADIYFGLKIPIYRKFDKKVV
ncbi:hypothetical protein J8H85_06580 [Mariniflexile gromovii]|uniref:DUF5723 domain-containing protein n=2 Tax=Mariniflexile gromovii TaxID=362523 RepID=A0ABS4BSD2_9FLAO|nr:hypothetical protein [Mariniflexile gromovii]